ncbi:MAG: hypothetical protein IPM63_06550 [Acidobacteriota bacterium]|nr:MAG: hypothetical protein IPM63_06550 [Acidobacteriota bacterium]
MNYPGILKEILEIYRKHGWRVSRVLLSGAAVKSIGEDCELLDGLIVESSDIDAVWFERPSTKGKLAIELRSLSETPFALFELVDDSESAEKIEKVRERVERKMAVRASQAEKSGSEGD